MHGTAFTKCAGCKRLLMVDPQIINSIMGINDKPRPWAPTCSPCRRPEQEQNARVLA